jgi:hypothetical protein
LIRIFWRQPAVRAAVKPDCRRLNLFGGGVPLYSGGKSSAAWVSAATLHARIMKSPNALGIWRA